MRSSVGQARDLGLARLGRTSQNPLVAPGAVTRFKYQRGISTARVATLEESDTVELLNTVDKEWAAFVEHCSRNGVVMHSEGIPTQTHAESGSRGRGLREGASRVKNTGATAWHARERLRKRYLPDPVRILFVGESPPASGRFFYQADSGLYRAVRDTFAIAFPSLPGSEFLSRFRSLGCYLVDLCSHPVDQMTRKARERACRAAELGLAPTIRRLHPRIIVAIVRSIRLNVRRAQDGAGWSGLYLELPYPGQWRRHRIEFERQLVPLLRKELRVARNRDPRT
jgi:hypothetical protein